MATGNEKGNGGSPIMGDTLGVIADAFMERYRMGDYPAQARDAAWEWVRARRAADNGRQGMALMAQAAQVEAWGRVAVCLAGRGDVGLALAILSGISGEVQGAGVGQGGQDPLAVFVYGPLSKVLARAPGGTGEGSGGGQ